MLRMPRNDGLRPSPRRGALHGRLACRIRGPQFHASRGFVGVDAELAALEQWLQSPVNKFFRRGAAMEFGGEFDDEGRLQRTVKNQAGIALDLGDIVAIVVNAV